VRPDATRGSRGIFLAPWSTHGPVVAFDEESRLQTAEAFVVLRPGCTAGPELATELQAFVKARLTPYKCPRRIEFLPELPKSAAGKLLRYKLRVT
jgi:2-aminobenzoate-CoA ligase